MFPAAPLFRYVFRQGAVEVIDAGGATYRYGDDSPPFRVRFHDRITPWKMLVSTSMTLGEGYMDGRITFENCTIYDFLELATRNIRRLESAGNHLPLGLAIENAARIFRFFQQFNLASRSKQNVAHHYDLSPALFELFLDRDRQYSCAYFDTLDDDIDTAQENKKRHLAAKLLLADGQRVLDIGCGWGGLALYIARRFKSDVTGITLSEEQYAAANERARNEHLSGRAAFELRDYRAQTGQFDRIVSVGMFEHVGVPFYRAYFDQIRSLLKDDGVAVVHTIGRSGPPNVTDPWIRKYIFPGGYIPALSEIMPVVEHAGLVATDIEFIGPHYAETLHAWWNRFQANRDKVKALYDERFCRMWEYYLAGSEVSFRHMGMTLFQIQIVKNRESVPMRRDYIGEAEKTLAAAPILTEPNRAAE
jgi:cyclopropane-fatty-acyl-phospholipid synthase